MTESTSPFLGNSDPQHYALSSSLTYQWDVATLAWVKGTQPAGGGGGAVTIADGADVAQGTTTDVAWVAGAGTVIALLKKIASAGGGAVSIADGSDVAEGATTDAAVVTDAAGTVSGKLRGLVKWAFERMPASLGSKTSANSFPVVIASDQAAVPVSGTVVANPTGYIVRLDEASSTITYVGQAVPGTATAAASWSIKRLDSTTGLIVLWGAGTAAFNQIWDNRAALAYS